jgi:uncharacterized protein YndB with AHSA1/START domain
LPRYAARRVLPATVEDVWAVLADPARFPEWWPGVEAVDAGRRGLVPGGLWRISGGGGDRMSIRPRPQMVGQLLVIEAVPQSRVVFQLMAEQIDVELELAQNEDDQAAATLIVDAPRFRGVGRGFPSEVLAKIAGLVRPAAA